MPIGMFVAPTPIFRLLGPLQPVQIAIFVLMPFLHQPVPVCSIFRFVPFMIILVLPIIVASDLTMFVVIVHQSIYWEPISLESRGCLDSRRCKK